MAAGVTSDELKFVNGDASMCVKVGAFTPLTLIEQKSAYLPAPVLKSTSPLVGDHFWNVYASPAKSSAILIVSTYKLDCTAQPPAQIAFYDQTRASVAVGQFDISITPAEIKVY